MIDNEGYIDNEGHIRMSVTKDKRLFSTDALSYIYFFKRKWQDKPNKIPIPHSLLTILKKVLFLLYC